MKKITLVTGNNEKVRDARLALGVFDIEVEQASTEVDEIQHHEPVEIALAKAVAVYKIKNQPLVINDSSWSIPALNGFPGGYMKDITAWLTTNDFLALMGDKDDKQIILHEVVVYIDKNGSKVFEAIRRGVFIEQPAGKSEPSFARIVKMENDIETIAQIFDKAGDRALDPVRYEHWNKFGEWYSKTDDTRLV